MTDYPTEEVECPTCDGCGQVEWSEDECDYGFAGLFGQCGNCAGTGTVNVCANCYDDWDGCTVCNPRGPTPARPSTGDPVASQDTAPNRGWGVTP